jgi:hypothetical protein
MAERRALETLAEPRRITRLERSLAAEAARRGSEFSDEPIDLLPYLLVLLDSWRTIATVVTLAVAATFFTSKFLVRKSYRALAIVRPTPRFAMQSRLSGLSMPENLASLANVTGGRAGDEAEEYTTILQSYAFTTALIERHRIDAGPRSGIVGRALALLAGSDDPQWQQYRQMAGRFSCDYSALTGNLTLYYQSDSAPDAQRVLGYYIDDLRDQLRQGDVQQANTAIDSMKSEAHATSDYLLQTQLYELIARQLQQLKLAEVQADFAFTLLEPPIAPRRPYRPSIPLNSGIAAMLGALAASIWVLARRRADRANGPGETLRPAPDDAPPVTVKVS